MSMRPSSLLPNPVCLPIEVDPADLSDDETFWAMAEAADTLPEGEEDIGMEGGSSEVTLMDEDQTNVQSEQPLRLAESGQRADSAAYQFCPPAHWLPILRLFAKHACQHSLLPERHGQARTANDIYWDAINEMYQHCYINKLPDVWVYLWNSWYCQSRWNLWARSAYSASIPRKRTTMVVEALWRGIKRLVLHLYNRPLIDLALYAIVTKALPPYRLMLDHILKNPRAGRAASLSHMQAAFKQAWERLLKVPIHGSYTTDLSSWTCDCGAQKYHSHLLCI
ncbi:hypothetical protein BN946_scf184816.g6 [Trametes cinnabarina]|uniref:Uncharacterized protein n=1 Tax=Pycnoporus cinnabarinus TaxID=5643 RepID=A0A060SPM6_PYCCI|nr:hypothetical protein BN946_scf184816.g6 [Trametes cinnabarina]